MRKNIIFGYIIFSIILFIALIITYSIRIKSMLESNYKAIEANFNEFVIQASSLYSYRAYDSENYLNQMHTLYNQEERILLFVIYSKTQEGIQYLYTENSEILKNTNTDRLNIGWQGSPIYADLPLKRFGTEVLSLSLPLPGNTLYADGIYLIMGRTDLFPFIVEILIILGAFLIITIIIFTLIPSKENSQASKSEENDQKIKRRRIIEELDNPIESEKPGAKNLFSPFTGLGYKENFKKKLDLELQRAESFEHDLTLIIISIDRYSYFEDHLVIYNQIGKLLLEDFKYQDLIFEYGEGRYRLILPAAELEECIKKLEYFKNKVAAAQMYGQTVTLSIGLSARNKRDVNSNILIEEAISALAKANDTGKNQLFAFKADTEKYNQIVT